MSDSLLLLCGVFLLFLTSIVYYFHSRTPLWRRAPPPPSPRSTLPLPKLHQPLHFALLCTGTRGDVQPFVALAEELSKRGHTVRVCAHEKFKALVLRSSLPRLIFCPALECDYFEANSNDWIESKTLSEFIQRTADERSKEHEQNQRAFMRVCMGGDQPLSKCTKLPTAGDEPLSKLPKADVIVSSQFTREPACAAADRLDIPLWSVNLVYASPTEAYGPPVGIDASTNPMKFYKTKAEAGTLGRWSHMLQWYQLFVGIVVATLRYTTKVKDTQAFRKKHQLQEPTTKESLWGPYYTPTLFAYSTHLLQKPWDWPEWYNVVGFFFLQDDTQSTNDDDNKKKLDQGLQDWLNQDKQRRPLCITFSSMHVQSEMILNLLMAAKDRRVIWLYGNNDAMMQALALNDGVNAALPGLTGHAVDVYCVARADHRYLLPLCDCVVHHGGAGTASATLQAGVPSLIVPQMLWCDQPGWGEVYRHGQVGVHCSKESTSEEFQLGLKQCDAIKQQCLEKGQAIQQENGCKTAVDIMETCLCHVKDAYMKRHCLVHRRGLGGSEGGGRRKVD